MRVRFDWKLTAPWNPYISSLFSPAPKSRPTLWSRLPPASQATAPSPAPASAGTLYLAKCASNSIQSCP